MKLTRLHHVSHGLLAAGLLLGAVAAQAAGGYIVTPGQESMISLGMTTAEVRHALGHPDQSIHYRNEPGRTFTYQTTSPLSMVFDVDFDAAGRVISMGERMDPNVE